MERRSQLFGEGRLAMDSEGVAIRRCR